MKKCGPVIHSLWYKRFRVDFRGAQAWFGMEKFEAPAGFTFLGLKPRLVHLAGGNRQNPGSCLLSGSGLGVDACASGAL